MGKFRICVEVGSPKLGSVLEALHALKLGGFEIQPVHEGSRAEYTAERLASAKKQLISPNEKRKEGAEVVAEFLASKEPEGATRREIVEHIVANGFQNGSVYYILDKAKRKKMIRFDTKSNLWHKMEAK